MEKETKRGLFEECKSYFDNGEMPSDFDKEYVSVEVVIKRLQSFILPAGKQIDDFIDELSRSSTDNGVTTSIITNKSVHDMSCLDKKTQSSQTDSTSGQDINYIGVQPREIQELNKESFIKSNIKVNKDIYDSEV